MSDISKRRLALACCAALAFAAVACDDEGGSSNKPQDNKCGDAVCTDQQECIDNVCKDKTEPSDPCDQCTDNQTCEDGKCVDKDPADPCAKCTGDQVCEDGVCKDKEPDPCADCASQGKVCDPGTNSCVEPPDDPCKACTDKQECVNFECVDLDPCANKTCPDNQRCDRDHDGQCVDIDPCEGVFCDDDQTCIAAHCIDNDCLVDGVEKDCGEGKVCSKGACVDDGCEGKTCDDGWQCIKGICEETVCIGYTCEEGRSCRGGACVDNECLDIVCGEGKVCAKGDCIYTQCVGKDPCPTGKSCNFSGECEYIEVPKIIIDEPEDKTTDEDGKTLALGVHLNNMPSSEVHISCEVLTESPNKEVEVSCDEIVFNADNWQLEQSIIVTGVADYLKDGDQTYKIKVTTTSEEVDFEELTAESVELTNIDTTKPGFIVSETSLLTYEDQEQPPATFTVQLASIPADDVSLGLSSSNPAEGTVSPAVLKFTKDNWNEPQTVTVTGVDDDSNDGNVNYKVFFADAESNDPAYNEMKVDSIKVTNVDNDIPGISMNLDPEGFVLNEGQLYTLKIKLNTLPDKDVKITMSGDDATEVDFDIKEVTLTPQNWKEGVEVQIIGVADYVIDGDQPVKVTFKATSEDEHYNLAPIEYSGKIVDTDIADILVAMGDSPIVKEGSNDSVTMSLTLASKPTKEVKVAVSVDNEAEIKLNKKEVTFKPEYWDLPQDVTVSAVDDNIVDGDIRSKVKMVLTSADANFQGKTKEIEFTTVDDDEAGLVIVSSPASFPENSSSSTSMTVALKAQPLKDVKVYATSSDTTELAVTSASPLTFTKTDWNKPKTVSVQVVDDNEADGTQTAWVKFEGKSEDPKFNGITGESAKFTIIDNDQKSVVVTTAATTLSEAYPSMTGHVVLGSKPSGNVTVTLSASPSSYISFSKTTVPFTSSNWNVPQEVTITANMSALTSAIGTATITAKATSGGYDNVTSTPITLTLVKVVQKKDFAYTGKVESVVYPAGRYKLEVWGAQGGASPNSGKYGGKGGYSVGIVTLPATTTLNIYVGQQGKTCGGGSCESSIFNGGGPALRWGGSGGGATDIRVAGTSLNHRLIVAGGGGGAYGGTNLGDGGIGGGLKGGAPTSGGAQATQTTGYSFGTGQTAPNSGNSGGAGGGGWYGGYASISVYGTGGGGSGYVYNSSTYSNYPSCKLNSAYYLTNSQTIAGDSTMPAPKGGTETGHTGDGYARITLL